MSQAPHSPVDVSVHEPLGSAEDSIVVDPLYFASEAVDAIASLLFECELLTQLRSDALYELSTSSGCFRVAGDRVPFALDHGLYIVVSGELHCHLGSFEFGLERGQFAGEHSLTQTLAGITPTFSAGSDTTLLHVPAPVIPFLMAQSETLEAALGAGPLFQALVRAAEQNS